MLCHVFILLVKARLTNPIPYWISFFTQWKRQKKNKFWKMHVSKAQKSLFRSSLFPGWIFDWLPLKFFKKINYPTLVSIFGRTNFKTIIVGCWKIRFKRCQCSILSDWMDKNKNFKSDNCHFGRSQHQDCIKKATAVSHIKKHTHRKQK